MDHDNDAADWQGQEARVIAMGVAWMLDLLVHDLERLSPGILAKFTSSLDSTAGLTDHLHEPDDDWTGGKLKMFIENVLFAVSHGQQGRAFGPPENTD